MSIRWTVALILSLAYSTFAIAEISFTVDRKNYQDKEAPFYQITGAPPNTPILFSSTKNGDSTGERDVDYGIRTDANGNWSGYGGPWDAASNGGSWIKTARFSAGGPTAEAKFWVGPPPPVLAFTMDRTNYLSQEAPFYEIKGASPNTPVLFSSTKNGASTGETDIDYGIRTDSNGTWSGYGGPWDTGSQAGFWTKTARVGADSPTAQVDFRVSDSPSCGTPTTAQDTLGIVHWGGIPAGPSSLQDGAADVQQVGAKNIFLDLSPKYAESYAGTNFAGAISTLSDLIRTDPFQQVLQQPFNTIVLNAFSFTNWDWTSQNHPRGAFTAEQAAREKAEIKELATYLMQRFQGTGKTFIIKNWEGDWWMNENASDLDATPTATQIQATRDWLNTRHEGLVEARQALSLDGVRVQDAVEFNLLDRARRNLPSALRDIVPYVQSDYVSYSSYDTINRPSTADLSRRIDDDVCFIRSYPGIGDRPLMIGEYGFSQDQFADAPERATIASQAFLDEGVSKAFYWQIADNVSPRFGLIGPDGARPTLTALGRLLRPGQDIVIRPPSDNRLAVVRSALSAATGDNSQVLKSGVSAPIVVTSANRPDEYQPVLFNRGPHDVKIGSLPPREQNWLNYQYKLIVR
jgi:hypothetical protein